MLNPRQLKRNIEGGTVQGISAVLYEEVAFDNSGVTNLDWSSYPIMTFEQLPEIKVVILDRSDLNVVGAGAEPPNALPMQAITAAFFDATGKPARTLPLRPANVKTMLRPVPA